MRNWSLLAAALLLIVTAVFHLTGTGMVTGWVEGDRSRILALLWISASVVWAIVAICWGYLFATRRAPGWPLLVTTAAIPAVTGLPLLIVSAGSHPGAYMLLGSSALALWSGRKVGH